jgi:hypothetical protein
MDSCMSLKRMFPQPPLKVVLIGSEARPGSREASIDTLPDLTRSGTGPALLFKRSVYPGKPPNLAESARDTSPVIPKQLFRKRWPFFAVLGRSNPSGRVLLGCLSLWRVQAMERLKVSEDALCPPMLSLFLIFGRPIEAV